MLKWLPILCLLSPSLLFAQSGDAIVRANQKKARDVLSAAIQALGGEAWLNLRTMRITGRTATFFQGASTGLETQATATTEFPDRQRIDLASKGRVVEIYDGRQGWEITYRGKKSLALNRLEDYLRWRDHSLGAALRQWIVDPATTLMDDGPSLVERRPADKVTLFHGMNDAITVEIDAASHLPLRLSFSWRDPQFHDKNLDAVEYDNYQSIDGIETPFTVTWTHNGQTIRERFLQSVQYNVALPPGFFDPDRIAAHLKK